MYVWSRVFAVKQIKYLNDKKKPNCETGKYEDHHFIIQHHQEYGGKSFDCQIL